MAASIVAENMTHIRDLITKAERDGDKIGAFNAIAKLLPQQVEDLTPRETLSPEERRDAILAVLKLK